AAYGGRVLDVGRRVADEVDEAVDLAVAERGAVLVGLELGGEREVGKLPAHRADQLLERGARAGARVAHVEALALEVGEGLDVRFLARDHGDGLGVQREHRAQLLERAVLLELALPLHGVVVHVGLRDAHVELARPDRVYVEDRPAGRLDRAADSVLRAVLVDEAADRPAGGVVHAGDATGSDGDELLLGLGRWKCAEQSGARDGCGDERELHVTSSWVRVTMMAACSLSTSSSSCLSSRMNGGASNTW